MIALERIAPAGTAVGDYDRDHLALYAALIDADVAGHPWRETAVALMHLDPFEPGTELCWRSHLDRARWIIGDGMAEAIVAFNVRPGHRA